MGGVWVSSFYIVWEIKTPRKPYGTHSWRSRRNMNSGSDFESFEFVSVEANHPYLVEDIPDLRWLFQPDIPPGLTPIISINTVNEQAASANRLLLQGSWMDFVCWGSRASCINLIGSTSPRWVPRDMD